MCSEYSFGILHRMGHGMKDLAHMQGRDCACRSVLHRINQANGRPAFGKLCNQNTTLETVNTGPDTLVQSVKTEGQISCALPVPDCR